ncbi:MAG: PLP-dependent aminotransferase family protein [Clostridia bacterium]|nr:PLP-dependent aminotransferase family protein [Clostridia bacterium]
MDLYKGLKEDIENGKYRQGEKLPSKRNLAVLNGVSIITVEHACDMLADEGYITPIEKKGYFVTDVGAAEAECGKLGGGGAAAMHLPEPRDYPNQQFEYSTWFKTVRKVISDNDSRLFVKSPAKGCEVLRNALSDYLFRYRGIVARPENIIIGSGAEQLYETSVKLIGRGKIIGIENPCYRQIEYVYSAMELKLCRLTMGNDGIETEALNGSEFDVLHVTPFHSFPTGITTSASKKREYLDWAKGGDRFIIEDDFDSEFYIPVRPIRTLYSMDTSDSVIYINTFSKSLSPAMRIGYMILPDRLIGAFDGKLGRLSCSVPVMDQYILAEFISSGSFERHLNRMRRKLKKET